MNSNFLQIFWIAFQIVQALLCLWIALIVFRQRTIATWMTLIAAALSPLFLLSARLLQHLAMPELRSRGLSRSLEISQSLGLGYAVSILVFLIGVLLHLQRRKLESDRIADLEAILQDRQQNSDPR
jgi:hypothetical protein